MYWDMGLGGIPPDLREPPPPTLRDCCFPSICPLKTIKFHKTPISPGMELVWLSRLAVYKAQFIPVSPSLEHEGVEVWMHHRRRRSGLRLRRRPPLENREEVRMGKGKRREGKRR